MDSKLLALIATIAIISSSMNALDSNSINDQFEAFIAKHGKAYQNDAEYQYRLAVYTTNMMDINAHNEQDGMTYTKGENQFTDITNEEFIAIYLSTITLVEDRGVEYSEETTIGDINWVSKGAVQRVKNQGQCGSCWAFSTSAVTESAKFLKTGTLGDFSEQQLVSCDTKNQGCNGGFQGYALNHWASSGICTESSYPYTSGSGSVAACKESSCSKDSYTVSGYTMIAKSVSALQSANNVQPVAIDCDASNWSSYSSGIFNNCGTAINHAILLAGYSSSYWLIKNSWGTSWGESGYIRLTGNANTCGILTQNVIPK